MGAPPGSRRFDGDLWPAPTGDDTFEALVSSSWADPVSDAGPVPGQVSGPSGNGNGNGGGPAGRGSLPTGGLPPYTEPPVRQEGNGRTDRQPPYADLIENVGPPGPSPFRPVPHQPSGQFPVVTPAQAAQTHGHPGQGHSGQGPVQHPAPPASGQARPQPFVARTAVPPPAAPPRPPLGGQIPPQRPAGGFQTRYGADDTFTGQSVVVPKPATVPIPPEALVVPQEETPRPTSGVPVSGAPTSGVPVSGVPASGVPTGGVPVSGVPVSGVPVSGVPVSGVPVSGAGARPGAAGQGRPAQQADRLAGGGQPGAPGEPGAPYRSAQSTGWQAQPAPEFPPAGDQLWHPSPAVPVSGDGAEGGDWATLPSSWGSGPSARGQTSLDPAGRYEPAGGLPDPGVPGPPVDRYEPADEPQPTGYQPQYQPYPQYHQAPYPDPSIQEQVARYRPVAQEPMGYQPANELRRGYLRHGTSPVGLPVRVPSRPDVPDVPDMPGLPGADIDEPPAEAPDLDRIADFLSRSEEGEPDDGWRPDGFDIPAVIDAVRGVDGVREAEVRPNPNGVHTLRLELADDADPAQVSRAVARLLKERMGLAAEPNEAPAPPQAPLRTQPAPSVTAPYPREARRRRAAAPPPAQGGGPGAPTGTPGGAGLSRAADPVPGAGLAGPVPSWQAGSGLVHAGGNQAGEGARPGGMRLDPGTTPAPRAVIDQVKVTDEGYDSVVEVRLIFGDRTTIGVGSGPAFDGYVLRLAAVATAHAVDQLLHAETGPRGRCFVEHATVVSLGGGCDVAVVVVLLAGDGWVEQLTGSALIMGDPRYAVVRATLAAVNRRLEALLW